MTDAISKEVTENDHIRRLVVTVLFVVGFSCFVLGLVVREIIEPSVAVLLLIVIGIVGATFFEYVIYGDEDLIGYSLRKRREAKKEDEPAEEVR